MILFPTQYILFMGCYVCIYVLYVIGKSICIVYEILYMCIRFVLNWEENSEKNALKKVYIGCKENEKKM